MLATSEIRLPEFRDAANKSEYRLIWLSTSQFVPFYPLHAMVPFPLVLVPSGKVPFDGWTLPSEIRFSRLRISILMNFGS